MFVLQLRLALHLTEAALLYLRYLLQCLPVYVVFLWLIKSPKIAGNVHLQLFEGDTLHATLKLLSLSQGISKCRPDVLPDFPMISWRKLVRGVLTGIVL